MFLSNIITLIFLYLQIYSIFYYHQNNNHLYHYICFYHFILISISNLYTIINFIHTYDYHILSFLILYHKYHISRLYNTYLDSFDSIVNIMLVINIFDLLWADSILNLFLELISNIFFLYVVAIK